MTTTTERPTRELARFDANLGTIHAGIIQDAETDPEAGVRINDSYSLPATFLTYLDLVNQVLVFNGATDPSTGPGIFLGLHSGAYKAMVGDPSGKRLLWDGSDLSYSGLLQANGIRYGPLHVDSTPETHTGTTESTLRTITIPQGVMGDRGGVKFEFSFALDGSDDQKQLYVRFGGTTLLTLLMDPPHPPRWWVTGYLFNNGAEDDQRASFVNHRQALNSDTGVVIGTSAIDTSTADRDLTIEADHVSSDPGDITTLEWSFAELIAPGS